MLSNKSRAWFIAVFLLFVSRGIMMSTWSNQGPAIKSALSLDVSNMGLYQMLFSVGSITGVFLAGRVLHRIGSRYLSLVSYLAMGIGIAALGFVVESQALALAMTITAIIGAPYGMADFDNNFEAGEVDRTSGRNRVPTFHFAYSAAVLLGGVLTSALIASNVALADDFLYAGIAVAIIGVIGSFMLPKENGKIDHSVAESADSRMTILKVLREKRHIKIVLIAFAFIVAEGAAVLWIPITLTGDGMSASAAALSFSVFALGMALMRAIGGKVADRLGRENVIRSSAMVTMTGITLFMLTPVIHLPYLGIALWGLGDSLGGSMTVAAMSDNPRGTHAKQSLLWLVVYIANFSVGPVLGLLSSAIGNYLSFLFPIAALALAIVFSGAVKKPAR